MTDKSSDLSDDIVPEAPRHSSFDRKFEPWHKVRKEFVRKEQWNKFVIRYVKRHLKRELQAEGVNEWSTDDEMLDIPETISVAYPLKCLVIPGDDILDIRSLCRDTENIKCYIRYLGFNEGQGSDRVGTRVHIAHNEVTSHPRVSTHSLVLCDRFQMVAKPNSQAYRYMKEFGPFHVVNLDLCDSLFPTTSGDLESYYNALYRMSAFQMKEMATPWLLFITTQAAPKEVDASQLDMLCKPTKDNVLISTEFAAAISDLVPTAALNTGTSAPVDCSQLNERQLIDLFGVAIGKALLKFCSTATPKWKVGMLGSHIYSIYEPLNVSMLSLAFKFSPVTAPPQDSTGLSSIDLPTPTSFNESELATKLVAAVRNISNIDEILAADPELKTRLTESSADLLKSAGYDRNVYLQWVKDGEQTSLG
ncbi:MAG: hypothetical protein HQ581_03675 [Planctomycetes bacterium]|nr:hypothetical protein [Planctomycetota bacterium]